MIVIGWTHLHCPVITAREGNETMNEEHGKAATVVALKINFGETSSQTRLLELERVFNKAGTYILYLRV